MSYGPDIDNFSGRPEAWLTYPRFMMSNLFEINSAGIKKKGRAKPLALPF
jgi:hypothetical protein